MARQNTGNGTPELPTEEELNHASGAGGTARVVEGKSSVETTVCGSITMSLKSEECRRNDQGQILCCVDGCMRRMDDEPLYYRRYKICKDHLRSWSLMVEGVVQRFCQQCGRFQPVEDFDEKKRNCRKRLEKHNSRRRKYLMTEDGSKIRKHGDMGGRIVVNPPAVVEDTFSIDIPILAAPGGTEQDWPDNGKELYNKEGEITAHPSVVAKKIAEYYKTPNRKQCFYPPFVRHVCLTERFLGQRILQNWMSPSDTHISDVDDDLRQAESMVYAIHQALSLEQTAGMTQADFFKGLV